MHDIREAPLPALEEALIAARKDFGTDYAKEQLIIDNWPNWAESKD